MNIFFQACKKTFRYIAEISRIYFMRRGPFLARGIAFSFLVGSIPLFVLFFYGASSIFAFVPQLRSAMELRLDELLPAEIATAIQEQAMQIASHSWTEVGLLTLAIFVFIAQGIFASIEGGLSIIMRCPQERHLWLDNVMYMLLTVLAIMLFFSASYIHVFLTMYSKSAGWPSSLQWIARKTTSLGILWVALMIIYRICYHGKLNVFVYAGVSLSVASMWQLLNSGASSLISATGQRQFIYGFLAGIVVFLLWAYIFAVLLLIGGIIISRHSKSHAIHAQATPEELGKTRL